MTVQWLPILLYSSDNHPVFFNSAIRHTPTTSASAHGLIRARFARASQTIRSGQQHFSTLPAFINATIAQLKSPPSSETNKPYSVQRSDLARAPKGRVLEYADMNGMLQIEENRQHGNTEILSRYSSAHYVDTFFSRTVP